MKSLGPTERDQDEKQGQGPASSRAEKMKNEEIRHTTSQTKKWLQGSHVPVSLTDVTEERGEEVEAPLQDAEWDHSKVVKTEVQQNSNCYNFQDQWVEEDQTPTSTKQAPRKQQVLRYLNIKFYATPILSSTLPQYQVLRYPNIKIQNVWDRHQACQRDDLNLRGLETIVHKHYTTLH